MFERARRGDGNVAACATTGISHGGSAMITMMVSFGILMSVHVHRDVEFGERRDEF